MYAGGRVRPCGRLSGKPAFELPGGDHLPILMSLITSADLADLLRGLSEQPVLLGMLIVMATFILEDAATIAVALLAAQGLIDPTEGLLALFIGISLGDIGLYALGRYAAGHPGAIRWAGEKRLKRGRDWLSHRLTPALLGARFLPGMRLPTYIASGFLKVSFWRFVMVAVAAVAIWTSLVFGLVYHFGSLVIESLGRGAWVLGIVLILIAIFVPKRLESKAAGEENEQGE